MLRERIKQLEDELLLSKSEIEQQKIVSAASIVVAFRRHKKRLVCFVHTFMLFFRVHRKIATWRKNCK